MTAFENLATRLRNHPKLRELALWNRLRGAYLLGLKVLTLNRGLLRTLYPGVVARVSYESRCTMEADFSTTMQWDVPCLKLIRQWTLENSKTCFFDVGANHGQFSLVVSRWLDMQTKRVFAFEPHPVNLKVLRENLARNQCDNVEVVGVALAAKSGTMTLFGESVTASLQAGSAEQQVDVPVETLDSFCDRNNLLPTIIKIDVEGCELDVLRGAVRTMTAQQNTIRIICEMHTFMWSDSDYDVRLMRLVEACGLRVYTRDGTAVHRITKYGHYVLAKSF